jgi:excinuclease UvrABC helicase subunit UvrB
MAIESLEAQMLEAAARLDFERAAKLRDQLMELKGETVPAQTTEPKRRSRRKRK